MFFSGGIFIGMIMVVNEIWKPKNISEFELAISSIVLGFGALIWFSKSLKCPRCGYKPTWPILKSAPASEWFVRITKLECCPECGD